MVQLVEKPGQTDLQPAQTDLQPAQQLEDELLEEYQLAQECPNNAVAEDHILTFNLFRRH